MHQALNLGVPSSNLGWEAVIHMPMYPKWLEEVVLEAASWRFESSHRYLNTYFQDIDCNMAALLLTASHENGI